jgi:hypothetical protein
VPGSPSPESAIPFNPLGLIPKRAHEIIAKMVMLAPALLGNSRRIAKYNQRPKIQSTAIANSKFA